MVERDLVLAMGIAEDVAAMTAVVAPFEKVERFVACGGVADGGIGIGFPMCAARGAFDRGEVGIIFFVVVVGFIEEGFVFSDLIEGDAVAGRGRGAAADWATFESGAFQAVGAPMEASWRGEGGCTMGTFRWSQSSGHVHWRFWWP